jgi:hypothetical protein
MTNRCNKKKIPVVLLEILIDPGPGIDSASNRNDYQEYFLGVKAAGV